MGTVPELPEVAALALFLRERTVGRVVTGVDVAEISALKTFSPAPAELVGRRVTDVCRHGKWIDLVTAGAQDGEPIHLVVHLARAGWLRWYASIARRQFSESFFQFVSKQASVAGSSGARFPQ